MGLLGFALFPFVLTAVGVAQSSGLRSASPWVSASSCSSLSSTRGRTACPRTRRPPSPRSPTCARCARRPTPSRRGASAGAVAPERRRRQLRRRAVAAVDHRARGVADHARLVRARQAVAGQHFGAGAGVNRFAPECAATRLRSAWRRRPSTAGRRSSSTTAIRSAARRLVASSACATRCGWWRRACTSASVAVAHGVWAGLRQLLGVCALARRRPLAMRRCSHLHFTT